MGTDVVQKTHCAIKLFTGMLRSVGMLQRLVPLIVLSQWHCTTTKAIHASRQNGGLEA